MAALLGRLTQPDTAVIRQGEQDLKPVLKNPNSMTVLWSVVADTSQDAASRHVGAIVLRKRIAQHYQHWDQPTKLSWQNQVFNAIAAEQIRPVRAGMIGIAAALAQVEQQASQPMLEFLSAASKDANPSSRELCFMLLSEMTDTVGSHWHEHMTSLGQLYHSVLHNDQEQIVVQKAAVQSLGALMSFWCDEDEIEGLAPLLPQLLQVASRAWQDDDFCSVVLDMLYDLSFSASPSLAPHWPLVVQFSLSILQNREMELRVRDAAALVIATSAESKPKTMGQTDGLLVSVLDTLFQLMQDSPESAAGALFETNPAWRKDLENGDDDASIDPDSPTETSMAQGTLDAIACEVPKKFIWPLASQRCVDRMQSPDPNARKAGVAGLGVITEGCAEQVTASLPQVLPLVFGAAQDPVPQVRECACFCLGQISEHCQPEILQYSEQILPICFALLDDATVTVQATSCYVLEMFCERLEPEAVRPVLDNLVRKLAAMLETTNKRSVQEMTVAALAATAVAAEEEFVPYVPGVAKLMTTLMQIQDPEQFSLRGRALECMGHMAIAVGQENFRPYFAATMESAMQGLTTDSTDLQEFAYAVFANVAKVMKDEFAPALPELVPHLVKVIAMDEGQYESAAPSNEAGDFNLDDSDEEDNGQFVLHVRTALLEVKKGALTALGEMAAHCGRSFCPHLESSMQVLQQAANNWHPLIKGEAADAFPSMIVPSIAAYHNGEITWKKGDVSGANPLSEHTKSLVKAVLTEELAIMSDEEKSTVGRACKAVQSVIELCGPNALVPVLNEYLTLTHQLLTKTAPCFSAEALYGEVLDDADADHDSLMTEVCDLVGAFGRVLGGQFAPYLPQFLPPICEFAKTSRPASDRSMALGCLAELAEELEDSISSFWSPVFLPAVLAGLADEDDNVKRNAAFCTGMCCQHLKEIAGNDYASLLPVLGQVFLLDSSAGASDARQACIDNATAAACRMIMAQPEKVPLHDVIPVILRALPLKADMTENETVYACVLGLLQSNQADILGQKPELKRVFTAACAQDSQVQDEIKVKLQQALQAL